ncbi:AAA family ATPase [Verrucomicrobiota bacterium]
MRLTQIELVNFRQHQYKKIPLTGNLIGIIGPNGSGKSNLLAGFQFPLSGEVPGITKEKLLRWGADAGYVQLWLDHSDGTECRLKRDLTTSSAEFNFGDDKIRGINNVNSQIKKLLEYDKDLGRQSIFVKQAELDNVLFETPSKREQAFQKLCGLGSANTLYKNLGEILVKKFTEPPNYDEQIAQSNIKLNELKEQQIVLNNTLQALDKNVISEEDITKIQLAITEQKLIESQIQTLSSLRISYDNLKQSAVKHNEDLEKVTQQLANTSLDELDTNIAGATQILTDIEKYTKAVQALDTKQKEYDGLEKPPYTEKDIELYKTQTTLLMKAYSEAQGALKMLGALLKTISDNKAKLTDAPCPLCGSAIKDVPSIINKLQSQIADFQKVENPRQKEQDVHVKEVCINGYKNKRTALESQLKLLKEAKDSVEAVDANAKEIQQALDELTTLRQQVIKWQIEKTRLIAESDNSNTMIAKTEKDMNKYNEELQIDGNTDLVDLQKTVHANYIKQVNTVDTNSKVNTERANARGQLKEVNKFIDSLKTAISDFEHKRASQGAFKSAAKVLTNVRDWFHYSNGPRIVSSNLVQGMTGDINLFLEKFEAPFRVTPKQDEGLAFSCVFIDGREMGNIVPEAEDLSGGQKITLAICFRLAGYCLFANKLGLLSLDEPTVYLDDKNIEHFCTLLVKLKEVANQMDLQILMATHERSLIPYMDTVVDLGEE